MPKQKKSPRSGNAKGKSHHKVKNWNEYNRSLKNRGGLTLWMSDDVIEGWYYKGPKQRGAQYKYSEECVETCCRVRKVYHLGLRQTQGLTESIMRILQIEMDVPDYTVISGVIESVTIY